MKYHILLVDDEPRFCTSTAFLLSQAGYHLTTAHSGKEALSLLDTDGFSLFLLDVNLPDMAGYEMIDRLLTSNRSAPVIMLTGNASIETAVRALKEGAYDYLRKPVDPDRLLHVIARAIKHSALQEAVRVSEERAKTMVEASWEGVAIHADGKLLDANRQFFQMFGYEENELLNSLFLEKIIPAAALNSVKERIENETFGSHQIVGIKKNGTEFPIETSSRPMEYQGRKVRVCALRDISERVQAEAEKEELRKQLAIAAKMETLGMMAGSVAHDLNNILSGLVTLPDLLLMQMKDDHQHRSTVKMIRRSGKEAASVVSDLITVARGATAKKTVCNFNELAEGYVTSLKGNTRDPLLKKINLKLDCELDVPNCFCSTVHINKVLMNLISNAAEEMKKGGAITVSTKAVSLDEAVVRYEPIKPGEYVVLSVQDEGKGISEKDIKKIFEPFYSKKVMGKSGTGLGLAIVWNTVHDHGGFIDLQSNAGGTRFDLYFPVTDQLLLEKELSQNSIAKFRGHGEKILVVDDQQNQRQIAGELLQSLGYSTESVDSGEEAVKYLSQHPVDLVILDMIMERGLNGRQTFEQILKIRPNQRALIASGFAENGDVSQTLRLGAKDFVKKPYSLLQIGQAVRKALSN